MVAANGDIELYVKKIKIDLTNIPVTSTQLAAAKFPSTKFDIMNSQLASIAFTEKSINAVLIAVLRRKAA